MEGWFWHKTIQGNNTITTLTSSPPSPSPTILALLRWGISRSNVFGSRVLCQFHIMCGYIDIDIFISKSLYIYIHIVPHSFQLCPVCCISRSPNKEHYSNLILPVMFVLANRFLTRRVMRIRRFKYVPNFRGNQMLVLVRWLIDISLNGFLMLRTATDFVHIHHSVGWDRLFNPSILAGFC